MIKHWVSIFFPPFSDLIDGLTESSRSGQLVQIMGITRKGICFFLEFSICYQSLNFNFLFFLPPFSNLIDEWTDSFRCIQRIQTYTDYGHGWGIMRKHVWFVCFFLIWFMDGHIAPDVANRYRPWVWDVMRRRSEFSNFEFCCSKY